MTETPNKTRSLSVKLAITGALVGFAAAAGIGAYELAQVSRTVVTEARRTIERSVDAVVPAATNALWNLDSTSAERIVDGLLGERAIAAAGIVEKSGIIDIAKGRSSGLSADPAPIPPPYSILLPADALRLKVPLSYDQGGQSVELGHIEVVGSQAFILRKVKDELASITTTMLAFCVAFGVATLFGGYVLAARPLRRLSDALLQFQSREPGGLRVPVVSRDLQERNDEIGAVTRAILTSFRSAADSAQALAASEARFRGLVEGSLQGCTISANGVILFANEAAAAIFGYESAEALERASWPTTFPGGQIPFALYRMPKDEALQWDRLARVRSDGTAIVVSASLRAVEWKGHTAVQETIVDVTDRVRAEDELERLATRDALTSLANRALFTEQLKSLLRSEPGARHAIFIIDLDGFKFINDTHGHDFGDAVIKAIAERLTQTLPKTLLAARLGGDDFGVIAPDIKNDTEIVDVHSAIMLAVHGRLKIGEVAIDVDAKAGVAVYPVDGRDATTLIANAETSMYAAKSEKTAEVRFFDASLSTAVQERLDLEGAIRDALQADDQFFLHYQPKICTRTLQPLGVEALVRWRRPGGSIVAPLSFIRIAEETGMIVPLGQKVLRMAARQARAWQQDLGLSIPVAVNVSAVQLRSGRLVQDFQSALSDVGLDPGHIHLEVTETATMDNIDGAVEQLALLRALGTRIAMDDFGTGYSSLSYLNRLPLDYLKLDKSFTQMVEHPDGRAIAAVVANLGKNFGLKLIAEGVETAKEAEILAQLGYDEYQGYHFSRALLGDDLAEWWKGRAAS